jgi:hypothetical protein
MVKPPVSIRKERKAMKQRVSAMINIALSPTSATMPTLEDLIERDLKAGGLLINQ